MPRSVSSNHRPAFSLIEMLMVMGIVMILIGLAIPMLRGTKERARAIKCLAQMSSHNGVLAAYAVEQQDRWLRFQAHRTQQFSTRIR